MGLSQENVALESEIDLKYYGQIERGKGNSSLRKIEKIAEILGISEVELIATS